MSDGTVRKATWSDLQTGGALPAPATITSIPPVRLEIGGAAGTLTVPRVTTVPHPDSIAAETAPHPTLVFYTEEGEEQVEMAGGEEEEEDEGDLPPPDEPTVSDIFEGLDEESGPPASIAVDAAIPQDPTFPSLDSDLTEAERAEFVKLLNKEMPLKERAKQLVKLAKLSGTKTAAVGLRAIQEINAITNVARGAGGESTTMFTLPPGTQIAVTKTTPEK